MLFAAAVPICFLLPEPDAVLAALPRNIGDYWEWQGSAAEITPYWGRYHWVLQSYLYLKAAGLPVTLCNEIPARGVIITHFDCVDYGFTGCLDGLDNGDNLPSYATCVNN